MEAGAILSTCRQLRVTHIYGVPLLWNSLAKNIIRRATDTPGRGRVLKKIVDANIPKGVRQALPRAGERIVSRLFLKKIQSRLFGKSVRYMISGGGYIDRGVLNLINALGYPLYNGYGLTEAGVTSVELTGDVKKRIQGSVGRPLYQLEYSLESMNTKDRNVGELLIRGPSLHKYHLKDGTLRQDEYTDGWMPTGDIARRDSEGRYWIVGRKKEIIINESGENIFPDELEWQFAAEVPHSKKVCITGVAGAAPAHETIILVLELKEGISEQELLEVKRKVAEVNGRLPLYRKVRRVFISANALPETGAGKVQRAFVRRAIQAASPEYREISVSDDSYWGEGARADLKTLDQVRVLTAASLGLEPHSVAEFAHYIDDLGGDSLSYASLIAELERAFGVQIPDNMYAKCTCVHEFALLVTVLRNRKRVD